MDPQKEYEARLTQWRQKADHYDHWHRRAGNVRLLFLLTLVAVAVLLRNSVMVGLLFMGVFMGVFLSGMIHDRILVKRETARRLAEFYERGLDRLHNRWAGKGAPGTEFLDKLHPYAIDLDVFGTGSLFEYVNTAQTEAGRARLAGWLTQRADPPEIAARQAAVAELRDKFMLREEVAVRAGDARAHIHTNVLLSWAALPKGSTHPGARVVAFCLPIVTWTLFVTGEGRWFTAALAAQVAFAGIFAARTAKTLAAMKMPAPDLCWLREILGRLEREDFQQARLRELQAKWKGTEFSASASLRRLERLVDWMDARGNFAFAIFGRPLLLNTQFAFALEAWRQRHGPRMSDWLDALGEMEALSSLGGYAYEHPQDVFPELETKTSGPLLEAEGLAHPLLAEASAVRNDVRLDAGQPVHVISGSNMSGKSTWLRAIGANLVLAMAGAPVRARKFRVTPMQIGASIRTMDSLQEGISRFYAEITRLRQIVQLTGQGERAIFLIDEVLSGTNSHDRRIGAASIVKALVKRGAIGLITTHDLALTRIVEEVQPPGTNYHFEDQLVEGKLSFDYHLRPGVVQKSNALDLMRSIGLEI